MESIKEVSLIALGWLFGMVGPIIQKSIEMRREKKDVMNAILIELRELQNNVVLSCYHLYINMGKVDKKFVSWALPMINKYHGPVFDEQLVSSLKSIAGLPDKILGEKYPSIMEEEAVRLSIFPLPSYVRSKMEFLVNFSNDFQRRIFSVLSRLAYVNECIDILRRNLSRVFEPGVSEKTKQALIADSCGLYPSIGEHMEKIANMIEEICEGKQV